jgi:hypothetical protein
VWLALGEVLRACGRIDDASEAVETAIGLYEEKGNVAAAVGARAAVKAAADIREPAATAAPRMTRDSRRGCV